MKRVLCLFYYFPPSGGAGALRCAGYARELLAHGWTSAVVAPEGQVYHTEGKDLTVPAEVEVRRTRNPDLRRPLGALRRLGVPNAAVARLARLLLVPDPQVGWAPFAWREACRWLAEGRFDALLSAGAPWSAHLVARRLARRHRLPWVAAFADEWSTAPWVNAPTALHRGLARHWEGQVLAGASGLAVATGAVGERLLAAHPGIRAEATVVANGFDEADFTGREGRLADRFTLVYAGTLYPTTEPRALLGALRILLDRHPDWRPLLRLRVLGFCPPEFSAAARRLGLDGLIAFEGPRPHGQAVQAMLDAHVLIDARADHPNAAGQRPVKLFEYLRAGRPVLGFYPVGEASALLAHYPECALLSPEDAAGGARTLECWIGRWREGAWPAEPLHRPGIEALGRAAQVARLARLLDRVSA